MWLIGLVVLVDAAAIVKLVAAHGPPRKPRSRGVPGVVVPGGATPQRGR